jgi:hypothetical protein
MSAGKLVRIMVGWNVYGVRTKEYLYRGSHLVSQVVGPVHAVLMLRLEDKETWKC